MTAPTLPGLHHVTAITADAQKNIDFYTGVLGLRLVKRTVNFDDPGSYHLYYGDELGRPGTAMTFFAWPGATRGRIGPPQATHTSFAIPADALPFWKERLTQRQIAFDEFSPRFGEPGLSLADPDGLQLEIIATPNAAGQPWASGPIAVGQAIRGFHGVSLSEEGYESTAHVLTEVMGFQFVGSEQNRFRYRGPAADGFAANVDLLCMPDARHGGIGAGVAHHVAFRTPDDAQQQAWRQRLIAAHLNVSPVMDRIYFQSIYYREPGGVLFEIATESPGFILDEPAATLGTALKLPPWLERHRATIEGALPPVNM